MEFEIGHITVYFAKGDSEQWHITALYGVPSCHLILTADNYLNFDFYNRVEQLDTETDRAVPKLSESVANLRLWCLLQISERHGSPPFIDINQITIWNGATPELLSGRPENWKVDVIYDKDIPLTVYPYYDTAMADLEPSVLEDLNWMIQHLTDEVEQLELAQKESEQLVSSG